MWCVLLDFARLQSRAGWLTLSQPLLAYELHIHGPTFVVQVDCPLDVALTCRLIDSVTTYVSLWATYPRFDLRRSCGLFFLEVALTCMLINSVTTTLNFVSYISTVRPLSLMRIIRLDIAFMCRLIDSVTTNDSLLAISPLFDLCRSCGLSCWACIHVLVDRLCHKQC